MRLSQPTRSSRRGAGLLIVASMIASCATPNAELTTDELAQMDSRQICIRYADARNSRESAPTIDAERRKRGLSCSRELDAVVGDCSSMQIVSYGPMETVRGAANVYAVRNNSAQPRRFRIYNSGIQSSEFTIRSKFTDEFAFGTSVLTSVMGEQLSGKSTPKLTGCQAL